MPRRGIALLLVLITLDVKWLPGAKYLIFGYGKTALQRIKFFCSDLFGGILDDSREVRFSLKGYFP